MAHTCVHRRLLDTGCTGARALHSVGAPSSHVGASAAPFLGPTSARPRGPSRLSRGDGAVAPVEVTYRATRSTSQSNATACVYCLLLDCVRVKVSHDPQPSSKHRPTQSTQLSSVGAFQRCGGFSCAFSRCVGSSSTQGLTLVRFLRCNREGCVLVVPFISYV